MPRYRRMRRVASSFYRAARRKGKEGVGSFIKPALYGALGGYLAPKIPVLNSLPYNTAIGGAAATYFMGKKSTQALLIGAAAGYFVPSMLGMSSASSSSSNDLFNGGGY